MTPPIQGDKLLSLMGISFTYKGGEISCLCPFHNEKTPSFFMNRETTQFYCFGCGKSGHWYSFIKDLTGQNPFKYLGIENNKEYSNSDFMFNKTLFSVVNTKKQIVKKENPPPQFKIIAERRSPFSVQECKTYCMERGIDSDDIEKYEIFYIENGYIGVTRFTKRLVIPIRDKDKNIIAYEGRDITRKAEKKCIYPYQSKVGSSIFQLHDMNFDIPTIFVEGIMDVIAVKKALGNRIQVSTCFGIQLTNLQKEIISYFKEITLFFDPDEAGIRGAYNFKKDFKGNLFIANNFNHKNDPGESSQEEIREAINNKLNFTEFELKINDLLQPAMVEW